jgi:hypothetical protein
MMTLPADQDRFSSFFLVVLATTLIGAFGASLGGRMATVIGGVTGLIWGILVGLASTWTARRWSSLPKRWLYFAVFVATTLFGGSLLAMLLYVASPTPENILALMRAPFKGGFTFFVIFNSLMEWLILPAALFLNWQRSQRRPLLIICAVLFYLSRVWTYVYFVPQIFHFMTINPGASISTDVATGVLRWVNLSWIRCGIDGLVAILFLRSALAPDRISGARSA